MKCLWFLAPMQFATQGQWWSNLATHWLHTEQCFDRIGRLTKQAEQNEDGSNPPGPLSASSIIVWNDLESPIVITSRWFGALP